MVFQFLLVLVGLLAGGIASIAGFGIGSLLTPLVALKVGIGLAVAGVSIAHFLGTFLRFIFLRKHINKKVLFSFGIMSAGGGLAGALLHNILYNQVLTLTFGALLIFAGLSGLTGLSSKMEFKGVLAYLAGALSGLFGGLVGNQGGIRSAALLSFDLKGDEFVATATGIALMVDVARVPVYLINQGEEILSIWGLLLLATIGVLIGTIFGTKILRKIPEPIFKKLVSLLILLIGVSVLIHQ